MPDLVYIVRPGENEELRYSLRSAVNIPHGKVWIVGSCPEWVRGAWTLTLPPKAEKWANIRQSLTAVAQCEEAADDIVLMCDDFFTLEPVDTVPMFHLGRLDAYIESKRRVYRPGHTWFDGVKEMHQQMCDWGFPDAYCYEGHMPMPFNRRELGGLLSTSTCKFLWGCAYSATGGPPGIKGVQTKVAALDQKVLDDRLAMLREHGQPFLSTNERSFAEGAVGEYIRSAFPEPGPYEEAS